MHANVNDLFPSHWRFRLCGEKHSTLFGFGPMFIDMASMKSAINGSFGCRTMNIADLCAM
ncbi:hypothetical protein DAPPUDRAFT_239282 [Daphnia pulex]|uniref:Uncharacterized protein n=1 Tax=Daphnia pulex TaxID=6669 RepID=E9G8V5_DAPPU|nr:hypothetical protein DAPPUDRAFT_239282 [Daphnia pulex]|eukprot:EFX84203.1 hypothetical protein DAPPUDRAFT_239282 [Daphnia pulex]